MSEAPAKIMKQGVEMDAMVVLLACEVMALIAVVAGHIMVPKDPQVSWDDLLAAYVMESTISN